jgi:hypothetical protein
VSAATDRTTWGAAPAGRWLAVADLLEHLTAMGRDEVGLGVANASAARAAHDLIVGAATCDECDSTQLDLEQAEVQR